MYQRYDDRETLERVKRWPSLKGRFKLVRIYSAEWGYFWRGDGQGYTSDPKESKVLTMEEALFATGHCGPEKRIQYVNAEIKKTRASSRMAGLDKQHGENEVCQHLY